MLRVGLLCHSSLGGSSRVALELAGSLATSGHEARVYTRCPPVIPLLKNSKLRSHSFHPKKSPGHDPGALHSHWPPEELEQFSQWLARDLQTHPVEVLHFHYALPFVYVVKRLRELLGPECPAIVGTLHGTDVTQFQGQAESAAELGRTLNETVDQLSTVSHALGQLAQTLLPGLKRPTTIPNFIDCERFRPRPQSGSTQKTLVHASNFRAVKRPLDMAKIFLGVRQKMAVKLKLLGTGPELERVVGFLEDEGAGQDVEVLGFQNDITSAFSEADALLVSSTYESFCMTGLEAMACGTPVIAPRVGGLPEVIEDGQTGFLYTPGSMDDAIAKTLELLSTPGRSLAFREKARERAQAFDSCQVVPRYLDLYRAALERPSSLAPLALEPGQ